MAKVLITLRIMPEGADSDLDLITEQAVKIIKEHYEGEVGVKREPIAFGLIAIHLTFIMEESEGGTNIIEQELSSINSVSGVDVINASLV